MGYIIKGTDDEADKLVFFTDALVNRHTGDPVEHGLEDGDTGAYFRTFQYETEEMAQEQAGRLKKVAPQYKYTVYEFYYHEPPAELTPEEKAEIDAAMKD